MGEKSIWQSKKFWVTLAGIVVALLSKVFNLDANELMQVLVPLFAYIFGQGLADFGKNKAPVDKRPPEKEFWKSKKFLAAAIGALIALLKNGGIDLPIPDDMIPGMVGIISVYITGQGLADLGKNA